MAKDMCSIDGCGKPVAAWGWCDTHYRRWRKHGDPLTVTARQRRWPEACSIDGCDGKANEPGAARGWCRTHYTCWQRHGDPEASASCAGCGTRIPAGPNYTYCVGNPECVRQGKALTRARYPETQRLARARVDKVKRRAAVARYKARADRTCVRPGCGEFALSGCAYCRKHNRERAGRRYERIKLRLSTRLYRRQAGMCPDISHGGCELPLANVAGNHVDHLIPIARGGSDDDWNLQLMHPECNLRKLDSLVPAAIAAAALHALVLIEPDGTRRRTMPACLLP